MKRSVKDKYILLNFIFKYILIGISIVLFGIYFLFLYILFSFISSQGNQDFSSYSSFFLNLIIDTIFIILNIYFLFKKESDSQSRIIFRSLILASYIFSSLLYFLYTGIFEMFSVFITSININITLLHVFVIIGFILSCLYLIFFYFKYCVIEMISIRQYILDDIRLFKAIRSDYNEVIIKRTKFLQLYTYLVCAYFALSLLINSFYNFSDGTVVINYLLFGILFTILIIFVPIILFYFYEQINKKTILVLFIIFFSTVFILSLLSIILSSISSSISYYFDISYYAYGILIFSLLNTLLTIHRLVLLHKERKKVEIFYNDDSIKF